MAKNVTQPKKLDMQSHIDNAYKIINEFLPETYLARVRKKLPQSVDVSDGTIRNVRQKTLKAHSQIEVLNALVEVALENKKAIEQLESHKY
ncbi:MAG TPA: hypothetical protein P5188_11075 [Flavobacterium sp.]|nr:hypothetical protein [Flavobacterium sp.]